jgi:hypothetical protein
MEASTILEGAISELQNFRSELMQCLELEEDAFSFGIYKLQCYID